MSDLLNVTTLRRPRLDDRHREVVHHRLTVVTAGAGFGKSTLLRAWAEQSPSVVLTATAADRPAQVMAASLLGGLRLRAPSLALRISGSESLQETGGGPAFASLLAQTLRRGLHRTLTLILDDVDELAGSEAATLIEALIRQLPPTMPVVVAGRSDPPFRLARIRSSGDVLDVTASDLAFTPEETSRLLDQMVPDTTPDVADAVHRVTGGWPVAVRLAAEALGAAQPDERPRLLANAARPGGKLFAYLAEEVLDTETKADRDLLRTISALGPVTMELCEGLGIEDARSRLSRLLGKGVYLDVDHTSIELTPLVTEHLQARYPLAEDKRREILLAAVDWHCSRAEWAQALERAMRAEDPAAITRIFSLHGATLAAGAPHSSPRPSRSWTRRIVPRR